MAEQTIVIIRLEFGVDEKALLLDITSLLYDFELLYDFLVLSSLEEYSGYRFTQYFWYRNGRPLEYEHRLKVATIVKQSPLTVLLPISVFVASKILLPLIEASEKIADWKPNREKVRLLVKKLELEVENADIDKRRRFVELDKAEVELDIAKLEREKLQTHNSILRRLAKSPIRLIDMSIETEEREDL